MADETKTITAMAALPKDAPVMLAWEAYKSSPEYANTRRWALHEKHVDGSLWAAFLQAWNTRIEPEAADRGVSEAVRALFAEAHAADDCHQMMNVDPRVIIALQTELRHLEAEVQSLRSEQEGGHD